MVDEGEMIDEGRAARRRRRARRFTIYVLSVVTVLGTATWIQRKPIASEFIDRELRARGVPASYTVADIGLRRQRLENIVIGDPRNPDLKADWAEVDVVLGLHGPHIRAVRAGGVRLRGRLVDGQLRMGAVDRLLPEPSGEPFALPDMNVALADARMRLETPMGLVGLAFDGKGNLANGFRGRLGTVVPAVAVSGCEMRNARGGFSIAIADRRPSLKGPLTFDGVACPAQALRLNRAAFGVDTRLSVGLDQWDGMTSVAIANISYGADRLGNVAGAVAFAGNAGRTQGRMALTSGGVTVAGISGQEARVEGDYAVGPAADGYAASLDGKATLAHFAVGAERLKAIDALPNALRGTPLGPLAEALTVAAIRAGGDATASSAFNLRQRGNAGSLALSQLAISSASGARLEADGKEGIRIAWPDGAVGFDGRMRLAGGGFPNAEISLRQPVAGGPISGEAKIAPFAAGGARLALAPVRFSAEGRQTRFDTRVELDGPIGDGAVRQLTLPVSGTLDGRGGYAINPGCTLVGFRALDVSGLELAPARLSLCALDGRALVSSNGGGVRVGGRIEGPRLRGKLGGSPMTLAANAVRLDGQGFAIDGVATRLGDAERISRLDIQRIEGRIEGSALAGRFEEGSGQIGNVPLLISKATGDWRFAGGALTLKGGLQVADSAQTPRFEPMLSQDVTLRLVDGRIAAGGTLREPKSNVAVTKVDIAHDLGGGTGTAVLDVPSLQFGDALQPEALTKLALGVVANVAGTVTGRGEIRWSPQAVTSDGVFRTTDTALAAAFGPVTGLSGEIRFTDLLGMETAPGQRVTLATVNPGILVENGEVRYQLLAGQRVAIEGGRWPFAGGELLLDPTIMDFGQAVERRMTFRVNGLDAAQFINKMEFENISATGQFDGTIPMVFGADGGRIENGALTVRQGGGTLAYVGDVSNAELGMFANMAFDALKSIRYSNLTIGLNGAIDGEMISEVRFNGVNQGTEASQQGFFREFIGLPFLFNIKIVAPFRGLLNTAQSFVDPSILIRDDLPPGVDDDAIQTVQPKESESMQ